MLFFRIDLDFHRSQDSQIFFSQIQWAVPVAFRVVSALRPQPNLEFEGQLHFESSFTQSLNRCRDARRPLHGLVDCRADFFRKLFGFFVHLWVFRRPLPAMLSQAKDQVKC